MSFVIPLTFWRAVCHCPPGLFNDWTVFQWDTWLTDKECDNPRFQRASTLLSTTLWHGWGFVLLELAAHFLISAKGAWLQILPRQNVVTQRCRCNSCWQDHLTLNRYWLSWPFVLLLFHEKKAWQIISNLGPTKASAPTASPLSGAYNNKVWWWRTGLSATLPVLESATVIF